MSLEPDLVKQLSDLIRPKAPGAHWANLGKKARAKTQLAFDGHGYTLGRISDYDTEVTADETWLSASGASDFPRLKPKMAFRFEVIPVGPTRVQVTILLKAPMQFSNAKWAPTQALLEPRLFEGKNFKIAQMPRRNGQRIVLQETIQTRRCIQNGARWIELDRPIEQVGNDMVASYGENKFGK